MKTLVRQFAIALPLCLAIFGCANDPPVLGASSVTAGASPYVNGNLSTLTYRCVDLLLAGAPQVSHATPLVVSSISDVRNVETTSPLGNIVADMIRTRAVQDGFTVSELRLRSAVSFKNGDGEFLLSRNRFAVVPAPNVAAVVTGTYAVSFDVVYVSLKLVSATDAHIIAGADFVVPVGGVEGLLRQYKG